MKAFDSLSDYYEWSLKNISIAMPVSAVILFVAAVVVGIKYSQIYWLGILFAALGFITIVMFVFIRRYMLRKIAELKQKEQNNGD
ncbi:MAG: hypothetical protein NC183_02480 [Corallococcus sp.]|nr:hypothetical protein [Corallococcus sp.]